MRHETADKVQVLVLAAGCTYEILALASSLPTITSVVKRVGKHRVGRVAVWLWVGYTADHFLEP